MTGPNIPYTAVLFDLDGTLTDSAPGIVSSLSRALDSVGRPQDAGELLRYVGPPLHDTLADLGLGPEETERVVHLYRRLADETDLVENSVFPGMLEVLTDLRAAGIAIALATSKPVQRARRIVEHFRILPLLDVVGGSDDPRGIVTKADVVAYSLTELAAAGHDVSRAVLVGDRVHDVVGAREHGVPTILAAWGYGTPAEAEGTVAVAQDPDALRTLLLGS
jgi:phosphoglycolate phosphatase